MTARMLWVIIIAGLIVITVFSFIGWIGSFSIGLGIVAVIIAIVVLQNIPQADLKFLTKFFLCGFALFVIIPGIYGAFTEKAPLTTRAMDMQAEWQDVKNYQKINPPLLRGYVGLARAGNRLGGEIGDRLDRQANEIVDQHSWVTGSDDSSSQASLDSLADVANERKKALERFSKKITGEEKGVFSGIQEARARTVMWAIAVIVIIALIAFPSFLKKWDQLPKNFFVAVAIFVGVFVLDKLVYAVTVGGDDTPSLPSWPNLQNLGGETLFWAIGLGLLALLGIAIFTGKKGAWLVLVFAIISLAVVGAVAQFSHYYWHGGKEADMELHNKVVATLAEVEHRKEELAPHPGHYHNPIPKRPGLAQKVVINLDPVHWSKEIPWSRDYNVKFEMPGLYEVMLSTGERIINKNDGQNSTDEITYIHRSWEGGINFPKKMVFEHETEVTWFRVRGAPGTGTVTVADNF